MMTGRGDGPPSVAGGPARHIPVLVRQVVEHLGIRDGGIYIDGTFGAGGYTRAILAAADCRVIGIDRDPSAIARGAGLVDAGRRPADAGRGPLLRARRRWRAVSASRRSTASCSISASPRCSSTRPSAASRSASTARSTCAWSATGRQRRRRGRRTPPSAISPTSSSRSARSAVRRARRPRHRRGARRGADRAPRAQLADIVARVVHGAARRHPSGDAHVPGAAHVRQRRARRARARRSPRPSACSSPAAGWSWSRSIRSKTASSRHFLAGAQPAPRAARAICRRRRRAPATFDRADARARSAPDDAEVAANPRARSAKLRAAERTGAPADGGDRRGAAAAAVARRRAAGRLTPMRLLHLIVVAALVVAAVDVYKIKFESTLQAERVAKLRAEIRRERDAHRGAARRVGAARQPGPHPGAGAAPSRSSSRSMPTQIDTLDQLPERPAPTGAARHRRSDRRHRSRPGARSETPTGSVDGRPRA